MKVLPMFDSLISTFIKEEPMEIAHRICRRLEEQQINIYAVVDHQADMNALQVFSYPAFTIMFGNPRIGSKLLEKLPCAAIDIPLRIAVIQAESGQGSYVIFRDIERLFEQYIEKVAELREWAQEINRTLHKLVDQSIHNHKWEE